MNKRTQRGGRGRGATSPGNQVPGAPPGWTTHDSCLWRTCEILGAISVGRLETIAPISTTFPPQLAAGERMLLAAPFELLECRPLGDGTYVENSSMFLATGRGSLGLMAMFYGAQAFGNAQRRARAAADAVPRLVQTDQGWITVSTHGFYLSTSGGLVRWGWDSVTQADILYSRDFAMTGDSAHGPVAWILRSDAAELAFGLWAVNRHPEHPRWVSHQWLPAGWVDWATSCYGRPTLPRPSLGG